MSNTPKKAVPRKAAPKPEPPRFERADVTVSAPPASAQSDETPHEEGVSGQPAEYAPLPELPPAPVPVPALPEPPQEPRESARPGSERHAEISAGIVSAPVPVYSGTFAIYDNPKDEGGYVLTVRLEDGTTDVKTIPSALVRLAQGGGGLVSRMTGLGKLLG